MNNSALLGLQNLRFYSGKGKKTTSSLHCSHSNSNCDGKVQSFSIQNADNLAPFVGLSLSLLHVHILWQQISTRLAFCPHQPLHFLWPSNLFGPGVPAGLPARLNDKWAPSPPKLSPCPLCFCGWWNTAQDLLQIVYFVLLYQASFCMARINLLPRQSTGEENKYSASEWKGDWERDCVSSLSVTVTKHLCCFAGLCR